MNSPVSVSLRGNGGSVCPAAPVPLQLVDLAPVVIQRVERPVAPETETRYLDCRIRKFPVRDDLLRIVIVANTPDLPVLVIAIQIQPLQLGEFRAFVDIASGDRAALGMVMFDNRRHDRRRPAFGIRVKRVCAFLHAPAVIAAPAHQLDHFPQILSHIAHPGLPRHRIKAKPPGIAKTVGPDLTARARHVNEWVVFRDRIVAARTGVLDIEPHHHREQVVNALAAVSPVRTSRAVTRSDVEIAIRTDDRLAAIVAPAFPLDDNFLRLRTQPRRVAARLQLKP